ncbi:hypothetical protein O3P69_015089 [Scylla paramamosain]|uniref:Major facilitator superfamily (MFS) profile domain-containing protein n=1 Tax=Scylla paramamosain TaxID=85552 RepID=A0AAW0T3N5_SCYPA
MALSDPSTACCSWCSRRSWCGRWSDRYGRRPLLVMCLGVSALSYLVLGSSASIWVVIGSRIVTGIFKHSTTLCKSVLADVTPPEDRPKVMGKFNGAMGIAIILSPAIGGHLAHLDNGFAIVCSVSGVIFLGNCVVCLGLLPHELPLHARQTEGDQSKKDIAAKPRNEWLSLLYEVEWKVFGDIFVVDFFLTFAAYAYRASFVLIIDQMFAVSPTTIGYIISFQGAIGAAAGFFAGRLSRFQGSSQMVLFNSALVQAASLLGLTFAPSILLIVMLLVPLSVSATLIHTATSTLIIDRCAPSKIGSVTGVAQGIPAIAGMTTPCAGRPGAGGWSARARCPGLGGCLRRCRSSRMGSSLQAHHQADRDISYVRWRVSVIW